MSETEEKLDSNDELKVQLLNLKGHPGFKYLCDQWTHFKNQCLNEILEGKGDMAEQKAKGEFTAYGRVLNSIETFIQLLSQNPGAAPILDPMPREKK